MTDKKPTDEEIIKALECHIKAEDCEGCEMFGGCDEIILTKLVLDLINRQQDEIVSLKTELKRVCAERDAHICTNNFIKSEAYKEFAKEVNEEISKAYDNNSVVLREHYKKHKDNLNYEFIGAIIAKMNTLRGLDDFIDNLLKEMVGEKE